MSDPPTHPLPDTRNLPLTPTTVTPGADLEPANREPMVWVPGPGNGFVAVPRSMLPADYFTPPAPAPVPGTTPVPAALRAGIDPRAQILTAGGIAAAGTGWGIGQIVSAMAGLGTAGLAALALALIAARMPRRTAAALTGTGGGRDGRDGGDHTEIHIHKGGRVKARHVHIR